MKKILLLCTALWVLLPACASSGPSVTQEDTGATQANLDETRKSADAAVDKVRELELEKARLEAEQGGRPE